MKMIMRNFVCVALLFAASICVAQMYTATDLGTLGGSWSQATSINASGQVAGDSGNLRRHAFRTAPSSLIKPASTDGPGDDIGGIWAYDKDSATPWGYCDFYNNFPVACLGYVTAYGINDSGQVVGQAYFELSLDHLAFRTAPNSDLPTSSASGGPNFGWNVSFATAVNASGQVLLMDASPSTHAFRSAPNGSLLPFDVCDIGTLAPSGASDLGAGATYGSAVNNLGQVVGWSDIGNNAPYPGIAHAFRTGPNRAINPASDDLGALGAGSSRAHGVNAFGQVVGDSDGHAFQTSPNAPINPATDDLGPGSAKSINDYGQVVGSPAFIYGNGVRVDLNSLIAAGSGCTGFGDPVAINNSGQIATNGNCGGQVHAVRLDPIYKANVRRPINADGSSVFSAKRGVIPVKFRVIQYETQSSCALPATIAITRAGSGTLAAVDENVYSTQADSGSNFRIDATSCQYIYHLAASELGVGTYRVDISINGIMVGHAVFALK